MHWLFFSPFLCNTWNGRTISVLGFHELWLIRDLGSSYNATNAATFSSAAGLGLDVHHICSPRKQIHAGGEDHALAWYIRSVLLTGGEVQARATISAVVPCQQTRAETTVVNSFQALHLPTSQSLAYAANTIVRFVRMKIGTLGGRVVPAEGVLTRLYSGSSPLAFRCSRSRHSVIKLSLIHI